MMMMMMMMMMDTCVAKPRLMRPLVSRHIYESNVNEPVRFHCEPDTTVSISNCSSSSDLSPPSITWYINAQELIGQ